MCSIAIVGLVVRCGIGQLDAARGLLKGFPGLSVIGDDGISALAATLESESVGELMSAIMEVQKAGPEIVSVCPTYIHGEEDEDEAGPTRW